MTVNKIGRPSKATERREEILTATRAVVAREGFAGATLSRIAAASGLQRTLVLHYFGDRESLIKAVIVSAVADYGSDQLHADGEPVVENIRAMFTPGSFRSDADLAVWLELVALSTRDSAVRDELHKIWTTRWIPELERQLAKKYPNATSAAIATAAHALACLFEGHWALTAQGLDDPARARRAGDAAVAILATLE